MHESAAPTVLRDLLRDRRVCRQRLEQLYEVGAVAHLQQHLPHLVAPEDLFTVHLAEPERSIRVDLRLEFARRNGYCDVIDEEEPGHVYRHLFTARTRRKHAIPPRRVSAVDMASRLTRHLYGCFRGSKRPCNTRLASTYTCTL